MELKPIDIAKKLGITVAEFVDGIDNTSSQQLAELRKNNPNKYELQILGIVCKKLNLDIDELIKYSELKKTILNKDNCKN